MLAKAPVVSAVAALSLALGIAANASTFSLLNAFLFEPLPFRDQDELVVIREGRRDEPTIFHDGTSVGSFRAYRDATPSLEGITLYGINAVNLTGVDVPEQLRVVTGTPNLFDVLGVQPALGRGFRPEEGVEGVGNVVVLEHDFWERRFLGDPDALGSTITLNGTAYTIVGVMPESFDMLPANVEAFRPTQFTSLWDDQSDRDYLTFGRLAPGATVQQAQREIEAVSARLAGENPDGWRGLDVRVIRAGEFIPSPSDRQLILILTAVTLFGLLIACANVANLLLGRAEERQKEVAVRTALGAGRHRILRQFLTESVTLGLVAGGIGILLAVVVVQWLQGAMPAEMPRTMWPRLQPEVVFATLVVSLLAGIAFGLAPAIQAGRGDLREALGEGSRGGTASRKRKRLRNIFVMGEFAVALALLSGAGYLIDAFNGVLHEDPGFRQEGLLTFSVQASEDRFSDDLALVTYTDELLASVTEVPGVQGAAAMSSLPRSDSNPSRTYRVDGAPEVEPNDLPRAGLQAVSPAYFETMEIPVRMGRALNSTDQRESEPVVVVNEAFVRRAFPEGDPIGRTVLVGEEEQPRTIVGVVGDILQERLRLAGNQGEGMYVPLTQSPRRALSFAVRVPANPTSVSADIRRAVWAVNPDQPVAAVRTLEDFAEESLAGPRVLSLFLGVLGGIALLLAAMGIYGVMSHSVAQQTREIGVRMALGASRGTVVGMVTRNGLTLVAAGMLLGTPLSYGMYSVVSRALNLFETGGASFTMAFWLMGTLAAVATMSAYLPARRASGVQPVEAMRD